MKVINMYYLTEKGMIPLLFVIKYECPEYIFCECPGKPEARGFYTRKYININQKHD